MQIKYILSLSLPLSVLAGQARSERRLACRLHSSHQKSAPSSSWAHAFAAAAASGVMPPLPTNFCYRDQSSCSQSSPILTFLFSPSKSLVGQLLLFVYSMHPSIYLSIHLYLSGPNQIYLTRVGLAGRPLGKPRRRRADEQMQMQAQGSLVLFSWQSNRLWPAHVAHTYIYTTNYLLSPFFLLLNHSETIILDWRAHLNSARPQPADTSRTNSIARGCQTTKSMQLLNATMTS